MMTTVKLGGVLGREFGSVWQLDIDKPAEAVRAIEANCPGFYLRLAALADMGLVYRVRLNRRAIGADEMVVNSGGQSLSIMPIVRGAGSTGQIIAGVALIVLAWANPFGYFTGPAITAMYGAGIAMAVGGVIQMLSPQSSLGNGSSDASNNKSSYGFGSTENVSGQGYSVPAGYGQLLVGSIVAGAGLYAEDMSAYNSANPVLG